MVAAGLDEYTKKFCYFRSDSLQLATADHA